MEACLNPAVADDCPMPISADEREVAAVLELRTFMADRQPGEDRHASLRAPDGSTLEIPTAIYKVLVAAVAAMAQGNAVSIVPVHHELTTQQAADLLNVSRPHLIKLLDSEDIPYHKTGSHRRLFIEDLLRYRDVRDAERRRALAELTRKSADLGLDY
jgi:excisionase family DNA binding protein